MLKKFIKKNDKSTKHVGIINIFWSQSLFFCYNPKGMEMERSCWGLSREPGWC